MNSEESKIRAIEREIDENYKQHKFLKLPTSLAIQYLLLAFEYAISPQIFKEENITRLYSSTHALFQVNKEALMEALNWIGEIGEKAEYKILIDPESDIYSDAVDFLESGNAYHGAVSAYTMWGRGLARAVSIDDTTVRFEYNHEQIRYDMLDITLSDKMRDEILEKLDEKDASIMQKSKTIIHETVKQTNSHSIAYSTRDIDTARMMIVALKLIKGFMTIPHNWKIFGFGLNELQRFWASLVSIGMLHSMAIDYAFKKFTFEDNLLASMIIVRPFKDWCRQLSRWTKLSRDKVEKILAYHIYSSQQQKPDIVLTPFIKVSDKHIAVPPNLLITNNLSRNFIKHIAKNYREEFDRNSHVFADDMLNKIKTSINKENILIRTNVNLPDKKLPDIDLCLLDEQKQEIMFCECRWTIPAADPYEVGDKVDIEKEKLSQMALLKDFVSQNAEKLDVIIKLNKKITFIEIFYVIVFENHVGSALTFNEDIPTINMKIFINLINDYNSLSESFDAIKKRKYQPEKDRDFKIKEETHKIGKYKILWTGFYP